MTEPIMCQVCHHISDLQDMHTCDQCGRRICTDCYTYCEFCRRRGCLGCLENIEGDEVACPDCARYSVGTYGTPYRNPYPENIKGKPLTIGIEIEINGGHNHRAIATNDLVARWCGDGSLTGGGLEYQTQPLATDPETLVRLRDLVAGIIPEDPQDRAGGHIHVTRTPRQTRGRWLRALAALDHDKAAWLNMRHADPDNNRWCRVTHREDGKRTAVNGEHGNTIELRTFGPWNADSVDTLMPAIHWIRTMWRFFENHPDLIRNKDIEATSRTAWANAVPAIARKGNR